MMAQVRKYSGSIVTIIVLCVIAQMVDGYDSGALGYVLPSLKVEWHLQPAAFTGVLVLTDIGLLLGGLASGPLADEVGRKKAMIGYIAIVAVSTLAVVPAEGLTALGICRFFTGVGMAGVINLTHVITADHSPKKYRARLQAVIGIAFNIGLMLGGLVAARVVTDYSWQWVFVIGGAVPLFMLPALFAFLPSDGARKGAGVRDSNATARPGLSFSTIPALFRDGLATWTVVLCLSYAFAMMSRILLVSWTPMLLHEMGWSPAHAILATTAIPIGGIVGGVVIGFASDKIGAEKVLMVTYTLATVAVAVIGTFTLPDYVIVFLFGVVGLGAIGGIINLSVISAAVYPPNIRATGMSFSAAMGRCGQIVGPLFGGLMLSLHAPIGRIFQSVAIVFLLLVLIMYVLRSLRRSRLVQQDW